MAVIVRKKVIIDGSEVEIPTYLPPGQLSKIDRIKADKLDLLLTQKMPLIAGEINEAISTDKNIVFRWFLLGKKLRQIVEDRELVSPADLSAGLVWEAIWDHLPDKLKPEGSSGASKTYSKKRHKRKDHLSLCFEISAFDWNEVEWIKGWDSWHQLAFRPGILRDKRIIAALREAIIQIPKFPSRLEFRAIVKLLGKDFPSRRPRESGVLNDEVIRKIVKDAVSSVVNHNRD